MLISLREDIKILFYLNEDVCSFRLVILPAVEITNLTSNANPRKHLIAVAKRLQLCVSKGQFERNKKEQFFGYSLPYF